MARLNNQLNFFSNLIVSLESYSKGKSHFNKVSTFISALRACQEADENDSLDLTPVLFFLQQFVKNQIEKIETKYWWCPCFKGNSHYFTILKQIQQKLVAIEQTISEQEDAILKPQPLANLAANLPKSCQSMMALTPSRLKKDVFSTIVSRVQHLRFQYQGHNRKRLAICSSLEDYVITLQNSDPSAYLQNAKLVLWALQKIHLEIDRGRFCRPFRSLTRLQVLLLTLRNDIAKHIKDHVEPSFNYDYTKKSYGDFITTLPGHRIKSFVGL